MSTPTDYFPPIEPYDCGLLDVGDGHQVYWEACGNPDGEPALVVHGGPGTGCSVGQRKPFDPDRFKIVLFDQRGCGRSRPHASDLTSSMEHNTTWHLVADMERIREHLEVEDWLIFGGSWGSTLSLTYAETHPDRVRKLVLVDVTTSRRSELDWLYRGVGRFFPAEWERFRDGVPAAERGGDLLVAYCRLMESPEEPVREGAADRWCAWEDAVLSLEPSGKSHAFSGRPRDARMALVRICAHYFSHAAWLEEGQLIAGAGRLSGIPGVLIHGRLDMSGPLITAWELARDWPDARLEVIEDSGHHGSDTMKNHLLRALNES